MTSSTHPKLDEEQQHSIIDQANPPLEKNSFSDLKLRAAIFVTVYILLRFTNWKFTAWLWTLPWLRYFLLTYPYALSQTNKKQYLSWLTYLKTLETEYGPKLEILYLLSWVPVIAFQADAQSMAQMLVWGIVRWALWKMGLGTNVLSWAGCFLWGMGCEVGDWGLLSMGGWLWWWQRRQTWHLLCVLELERDGQVDEILVG